MPNQSPLFVDVIRDRTYEVSFTINDREHHIRYYLVDVIYLSWPMFVKGVPVPQQEKHQFFLMKQASVRKKYGVCFQPTEEEVQHTSYHWPVLLSTHS
jgi:hypothetical protein